MKRYIKSSYKMQDTISNLRNYHQNNADGNKKFLEVIVLKMEDYFQHHPGVSLETMFGILKHNDDRFEDIFEILKRDDYHPRKTWYMDRISTCALTIDVPTREIPEDVLEVISKYPELAMYHVTVHKGQNSYKLKFELRDEDYRKFRDDIWAQYMR